MKSISITVVGLFAVFILSLACGGSNGSSSTALEAPVDSNAFSGVNIQFNPTIAFTSSSTFSYTNDETDTEFPSGNSSGNFSYSKISSSQGNLILTFSDSTVLPLTLTGFTGSLSSISSFGVSTASGNSYSASVTSGTLAPEITISSGSGGSSSSVTIPESLSIDAPDLTYNEIVASSTLTYGDGDIINFAFSSSGLLFVTPKSDPSSFIEYDSVSLVGSEYVWEDSATGISYAVSLDSSGNLHEINVSVNNSFVGQFAN